MAADNEVDIDINADDNTGHATESAANNFDEVGDAERRTRKETSRLDNALRRVGKSMAKAAVKAAAVGAKVAAAASAAGPLAMGMVAVAKGAAVLASKIADLTPLVAFGPSLAAALGLVAGTLKALGPGLVEAVKPVTEWFVDAAGDATGLTLELRKLGADGVRSLAEEFSRLSMPVIADGMRRIATATNGVVVATGRWLNSAEGQALIRTTTEATARGMEVLAPKVTAAAIALGQLAGRAGDQAITGLADLIGRILDKFTAWANSTSVDDIKRALSDLSGYFTKLRQAASAIRDIGGWLADNVDKARSFSTAASAVAVALALLSGQWWVAAVAGLSAVITNWDRAKQIFAAVSAWWSQTWTAIVTNPQLRGLAAAIGAHIGRMTTVVQSAMWKFQADILPKLQALGNTIMTQLVPAITNFVNAISPLIAAFTNKVLPVIMTVMGTVVDIISGAVTIISGIINVFAAVLSGDWTKLWEGMKQIYSGAWAVIVALLGGVWGTITGTIKAGVETVVSIFTGWKDRVVGIFNDAKSWLSGVGRSIVQGLADAISGAWGAVSDAINGLVNKAKGAIPDGIRGLFTGALGGWQPAQFSLGFGGLQLAAIGGGGRTQAATPIVHATTTVMLDGREIRAVARTEVRHETDRQAWRATAGRR